MAQPECTFCGEEYGVLMDSDLVDGGTQVIGPACLPGYAIMLAAAVTTGMTPELAEVYGQYFDQIAANDTRVKRVNPPRSRRKQPQPGEHSGNAAQESGTQPTSSDTSEKISDTVAAEHVMSEPVWDDKEQEYHATCSCGESYAGDQDNCDAAHSEHLQYMAI